MPKASEHLLAAVRRAVTSDANDLYVLFAAGFLFTVLGAFGVASVEVLSSVILGLLTLLALSQVRSRHQVSRIAEAANSPASSLFLTDFPPELADQRATAIDYLYVGTTMARTVQTARRDMKRILGRGGRVRVVLLDPEDVPLVYSAATQRGPDERPEDERAVRVKRLINASLAELDSLRSQWPEQLQIRLTSFVPRIHVNAIDTDTPTGAVYVQHYEHRPVGESSPIFRLGREDGYWYQHFVDELERIWESASDWAGQQGAERD